MNRNRIDKKYLKKEKGLKKKKKWMFKQKFYELKKKRCVVTTVVKWKWNDDIVILFLYK